MTRPLTEAERDSIGMGRKPIPSDQHDLIDDNRGAQMLGTITILASIVAIFMAGWVVGIMTALTVLQ